MMKKFQDFRTYMVLGANYTDIKVFGNANETQ